MRLPALALFERSLRVETRSALMSWSRAGLLVVILMMLFPVQTMARMGFIGAPGLNFLSQMVWLNLVFITLTGLSYFASAITEEKEEMMLGLLRMTDLNAIAILLGKSTSRLVGALLLLLVQVPFILLAVTLGGVGLLQITAAYGTLLAYLFLVCNLALFFSVVFRNTVTAAGFTLAALLIFLIGPYWAASIENDLVSNPANLLIGGWSVVTVIIDWWRDAAPGGRLGAIFQTGFTGPAIGYQVVSNLVLGVFFFILSWLLFERCTHLEKDPAPARRMLVFASRSRRSLIPSGIAGPAAITWKDFTFVNGGRFGLLVKFALVVGVVGVIHVIGMESGDRNFLTREFEGNCLIWVSLGMTALFLALDAGRIFREEVRWKTLSSLVTLPISIRQLAYRKVAGALLSTLPVLAGCVLGLLVYPEALNSMMDNIFTSPEAVGGVMVAVLQFILFLHLTAFLSLVIKRGALPLAIAIQYVGGSFSLALAGMVYSSAGGPGGFLFLVGLVCTVLIGILHRAIGFRLERVAAEE